MHYCMTKNILLLFCCLLAALDGAAQEEVARWYLRQGVGSAIDLYRDYGTSPLTYRSGVAATMEARVTRERSEGLQLDFHGMVTGGMYHRSLSTSPLSAEAFGANATLGAKATWRRGLRRGRSEGRDEGTAHNAALLAGCSLDNLLGVKYNTRHENASVGASEFILAKLHAGAEWTWGKCLLHAEASLAPLAVCFRPGYAYMDNYTEENSLLATLGNGYEWSAKPFAAVGTGIGARWTLKSGHRLGCEYEWSYLGTGGKGAWKYQTALHNLKFYIDFKLK